MSKKTAFVIVVYNKKCEDAPTCEAILRAEIGPDLVLVIDNSTRDMGNQAFCMEHRWGYFSMNGNAGLSKAYNTAIDLLKDEADYVVWADDDTKFPADYFSKLQKHIIYDPKASVYLPVVRTPEYIMSPCVVNRNRVNVIQCVQELENQEITGINSGMAVRLGIYDDFRYDEAIFLDCVDHDFMRWCRLNGCKIRVMGDVELHQSFFADSKPSRASRKIRSTIYMKDYRVFQRKCGRHWIAIEFDLLEYRLRQLVALIKQK